MEIRSNEQILTEYMRQHYSDEQLAALLAHAEDGKLAFQSCCCFIGIPTADHALQGRLPSFVSGATSHYLTVKGADAGEAELCFLTLGQEDEDRRARLIPLIHAEVKRRDELKSESPQVIESQILIGPRFSMIG